MPFTITAASYRRMWCLLLVVFAGHSTFAQDLGNIGKSPLLKVNGGISASAIAYTSNDSQRRTPFSYYLKRKEQLSKDLLVSSAFNIPGLPAGVYVLLVESVKEKKTLKVLIL